jgi:hypothetical protein
MSPINTTQYLLQNNHFYEESSEDNSNSKPITEEIGSMLCKKTCFETRNLLFYFNSLALINSNSFNEAQSKNDPCIEEKTFESEIAKAKLEKDPARFNIIITNLGDMVKKREQKIKQMELLLSAYQLYL